MVGVYLEKIRFIAYIQREPLAPIIVKKEIFLQVINYVPTFLGGFFINVVKFQKHASSILSFTANSK